ncbi:MAG: hypothetical protein WCB68_14690 [Pyrinomonadaceae bacterium]
MKKIVYTSILALVLTSFAIPHAAAATASGATAEGRFQYSVDDGFTKYIEFSAAAKDDGTATGKMVFSGPAEIPDQDVDGAGKAGFSGKLDSLYIEVEFDGMAVEKNRAVMSGVVTNSNVEDYVKQRVLLVVEDNGTDGKEQDKVTLGFYKPAEGGWIPSDAELKEDNGASMTWWATDAERKDDVGVASNKSKAISAQSFPLSTYEFADVKFGDGDIQVKQ